MKRVIGVAQLIDFGNGTFRSIYQCRPELGLTETQVEKVVSDTEADSFTGTYKTNWVELSTGIHECILKISTTKTKWPGGGYDLIWQDAETGEKLYEGIGQVQGNTLTAAIWQ